MALGLPDSWATYGLKKAYKSSVARGRGRGGFGGLTTVYTVHRIRVYRGALNKFLNTPAGPLWGEVEKRARIATAKARRDVGVKTGALRASIYMRHLGNATGQYVTIGSNKTYAFNHHQGTKPHVIVGSSGGNLKFVKNGKMIYTKSVFHPGNRPNRFLSKQLHGFVRPRIVIP